MSLLLPLFTLLTLVHSCLSQSNYADQTNSILYPGDGGLPDQATLDGKVTKLDDLMPRIFLNRTKAELNCAAGSMQIELKFNERFHGIAYADFDRNSACQVFGKGGYSYTLEIPLKGCGTIQDPQRVFTNNIVVRFHPGLEIDGDETITVVCRYPPPVAPLPPAPPGKVYVPQPGAVGPPLKGFQILLIICGILFLSLLLLGLGCSYYCLRKRRVTVFRQPFSSLESGSEITKLSSSIANLPIIDGVKIPRVHAPLMAAPSSSGSEAPIISDTLPSDYPSESHSEEDGDTRSLPASSGGSYDNKAYVQDTSSFYSEGYTQEQISTTTAIPRLPMAVKEQPKFDVQVRVKKSPTPPSISLSDSESSKTDRNLSTIMEQREESIRSMEMAHDKTQFTYIPELHPPPKHVQPAPTYNRILRRQQELQEEPRSMSQARSLASLNTEITDTHSVTEVVDSSHHKYFKKPAPPPPPPIIPKQKYTVEFEEPDSLEPPIAVVHKPEITSHLVDDVFLKTITEKKTIEDIERHKRLITEYHTRAKPVDQKWDVTIRNFPGDLPEPPEWENFSDVSSASGLTLTPKPERAVMSLPPKSTIDDNKLPLNSPELVGSLSSPPPHIQRYTTTEEISSSQESYLKTYNIPAENPSVPNWNVLIRVLQPTEQEESPVLESAEMFNSQLTVADKLKWRQIITTESTLRTLLTEAVVREDYERIRRDTRYEKLFDPPKWDVIIRILTPLDKPKRFKKKGDWDTRSRRSSLPTLYEYDSDGGSSVRTLTQDPRVQPVVPRRSSRSSYRSDADLRSMSEMTVDFARPDHMMDTHSEASSYYPQARYYDDEDVEYKSQHHSLVRSLSQPSLARSASEFTERWVAPSRYDTASEFTSPEGTPKSHRSSKMQSLHQSRGDEQTWISSSRMGQRSGGATQVVTQEFRSEASSYRVAEAPRKVSDWFEDK